MFGLLKNKVLTSVLWSFTQRTGSLVISFLANLVLARLLSPEDFGCISVILVFVSFADVLIDGGLGCALIQKKNICEKDISTVFTSNLVISVFLFLSLFFAAPFIACFFNIPNLDLYLRIESIAILIRAFYVVQSSVLNKNLEFKNIAGINIISAAVSAFIGIILAYMGFGIWSLIVKNVVQQFTLAFSYRCISKIPFKFGFDKTKFVQLFSYGWFVALTNFIDLFYSNLISFVIGKRYSVKELGYYNQAYTLQQIPTYSLSMVVNQVLFPYMSRVNNDLPLVKKYAKQVMIITSFFVFPLMFFLIIFSEPIIIFLYPSKWLPSSVFFQVLCIGGLFNALIHVNRNVLKSIGKTKILFMSQILVTVLGIVLILFSCHYDIMALVACVVICSFINWLIISIISGKLIEYSFGSQIYDITSSFVIALIVGSISNYIYLSFVSINILLSLILILLIYIFLYFVGHYIFKTKALRIVKSFMCS